MIKIQGNIPRTVKVACSGGIDSMAIVDFLSRNHEVTACYFDHGTEHGYHAGQFLEDYYAGSNVKLIKGKIDNTKVPKRTSQEEHWRNQRYDWFKSLDQWDPIITCHHLEDCVETWVWSSMNGTCNTVPYQNGNVIRPFRLNRKRELELWCRFQNVKWIEDPSNNETKHLRNYIRHEMMPHVLKVNPGIHKMVKKKMLSEIVE